MAFTIIINPVSGGARCAVARRRVELAASIRDAHGNPAEVVVTERPGHARELTKAARARGASIVFAWGGDGTINEIATELAFGDLPLGIVPAGSGNGLALELGVAADPARAIAHGLSAEPRSIDVGELAGRLFVNIAGIGFDAHVASLFNRPGNVRRGFARYVSISGRALLTYKAARYTITTGATRVDDGLLDLVVVDERSRPRTICGLPRLFNGTVERMRGCSIAQIREATIQAEQPMIFHVDGEPVQGGTELRVRVHPAALRIAV
jgi:diacylglycerol kinase (ATP)